MSDLIDRQAAIDALKNDMASLDHIIKGMSANDVRLDAYVSQRNQVNYDIYAIEQLPPAQPERIKGHWIEHDDGLVACECSVCHEKYNLYEEDVLGRNFCPNCGAEMEVTT